MNASEIKFDCPECGEGLVIDHRASGHQVACPFCKDPITVPEVGAAASEIPKPPDAVKEDAPAAPSLEELASSRPEIPEVVPKDKLGGDGASQKVGGSNGVQPAKGGLPPQRKPGEKPRAMAEGLADQPGMLPPQRGMTPMPPPRPPGAAPPQHVPPAVPQVASQAVPKPPATPGGGERAEETKPRNPDDHRLNPRAHPKMVSFDEAISGTKLRKHPGHVRMSIWMKLALSFAFIGILGGIGLGVLKHMELKTPDVNAQLRELTPMEKEFVKAKERLDLFRNANSVNEKRGFVREPITQLGGYPKLTDRMSTYYHNHTLKPHFPVLDMASTTIIQQEYDLRLMSVAATDDLVDEGSTLVIVALVGTDLHVRIFDASAEMVVDKPENELVSGQELTELKALLNSDPFPIASDISQEEKQEIINRAASSAGHALEQGFLRISMTNKAIQSFVYFKKSAAGYALDWDSFVGYNPLDWTEFLINVKEQLESGIFRLILEPADKYTGIYQDQGEYRSYRVTDLASNLFAFAYVARGSPPEQAIEAELAKLSIREEKRVLLIAEVDLVERAVDGSNLVYIKELLRIGWLLP